MSPLISEKCKRKKCPFIRPFVNDYFDVFLHLINEHLGTESSDKCKYIYQLSILADLFSIRKNKILSIRTQ